MNKILIAVTLAVASMTVQAEEADAQAFCTQLEGLAKTIMTARHRGVPMSKAMSIPNNLAEDNPMKKVVTEMVMNAYGEPAYQTETMRASQLNDFANEYALTCYRDIASNN